ncbi:MAG: hypothetical protein AB2708_19860 [Candidatus Thiodiazotropha taylori]
MNQSKQKIYILVDRKIHLRTNMISSTKSVEKAVPKRQLKRLFKKAVEKAAQKGN